jgi:hypothetical protein
VKTGIVKAAEGLHSKMSDKPEDTAENKDVGNSDALVRLFLSIGILGTLGWQTSFIKSEYDYVEENYLSKNASLTWIEVAFCVHVQCSRANVRTRMHAYTHACFDKFHVHICADYPVSFGLLSFELQAGQGISAAERHVRDNLYWSRDLGSDTGIGTFKCALGRMDLRRRPWNAGQNGSAASA